MAREEIFFGINIDTGDAIKDFGTLKNRTKALKKELDGTKVGTKRFEQLKTEITRNQATIRRFNRELRQTKSLATRVGQGMTNAFSRVGGVLAGAFAVSKITSFMKESVEAYDKQEKAVRKVEQAILSTGQAAQLTLKDLTEEATNLQKKTIFGDEDILNNATAQLLTFTNITEDNFLRTQKVALDLATVLDGDLKSASIQLGKALNDPVANLSALSRSGIQFSTEQKAVIKELATTNRLAEAQGVILKELERQYGGQAEAAAQAGAGGLQQLSNSFGDLQESIGGLLMEGNNFTSFLQTSVELMTDFTEQARESSKALNQLEQIGFEKGGLFGTGFFAFDIENVRFESDELLNETEKTAKTILFLQENFENRKQQLIQSKDKENLQTIIESNKKLIEDIKRTGKAAGDLTGENAEAFIKLYELQSREAINAINEIDKANTQAQEKALQEQKEEEKASQQRLKRLEEELRQELEYRRLRAEIRLDGVEESIELIDIEFDARREKLLEAGLTEQEILFAEEQAKEEIRQQFRDKQLAAEQKKQSELQKTRLAQGEFEEKQKEKAEQRFQAELAMNNARLEAMSSMVGSVITLLSRDEAARKKNANLIKALSISDVIINTQRALANVTTNTSAPTPQNLLSNGIFGLSLQTVQKAAILLQSAGSIATIAAQKFQRGGVLKGSSHANGGIPIMAGGGMVEAEGGEAIINKKSTAAFAPILSAINSYGGYGDKFERGGLLGVPSTSPVGDTTNAQLLGALNNINFQPTVSVIEINEAQTRINEVNTSSQL